MKILGSLFLMIIAMCPGFSQTVLIPYRAGSLFGLSDEKGKIIVTPAYDHVEWMRGAWFRTTKRIEVKDTLEYQPHKFFKRNSTIKMSGLIHNGKTILSNEPFDDYEIIANKCIVAECNRRSTEFTKQQLKKYGGDKRKFVSLFNLQGKNLYPDNFKRIQKVDTAGASIKTKGNGRYLLLVAQHFDDTRSLFVFDADKQEISEWLITKATKLDADELQSTQRNKRIVLTVTDKNYAQITQVIDYNSGKFVLKTLTDSKPNREKPAPGDGTGTYGGPDVVEVGPESYKNLEAPVPGDGGIPFTKSPFNDYHQLIKDTLYYIPGENERRSVSLPAGTTVLLKEPRGINQYEPVMARSSGRFYIINTDRLGEVAYDSLIYFEQYFLAWQTVNSISKAAVIRADGSVYIPMQYDSIYAGIPLVHFEDKNPGGKSRYELVLKEADSKYNYEKRNPYSRKHSDRLTVFLNGRAGVISMKGDTIIPIAYQMIAQNNIQNSGRKDDDFVLLKKDDRYGMTKLKYDTARKQPAMGYTIAPRFKYIPAYFYPDYYGIKGYKLIGLYDEHFVFKGFATEYGREYFKED